MTTRNDQKGYVLFQSITEKNSNGFSFRQGSTQQRRKSGRILVEIQIFLVIFGSLSRILHYFELAAVFVSWKHHSKQGFEIFNRF